RRDAVWEGHRVGYVCDGVRELGGALIGNRLPRSRDAQVVVDGDAAHMLQPAGGHAVDALMRATILDLCGAGAIRVGGGRIAAAAGLGTRSPAKPVMFEIGVKTVGVDRTSARSR